MKEKKILTKYFRILEENGIPQYIQSKHKPISFKKSESTKKLWDKHEKTSQEKEITEIEAKQSLLDLKIELASRIYKNCHFCERRCKTDRNKEEGHCKVKKPLIASEFLHMGKEPPLVPSYTVFFSGCTFNCVFCQNWDISQRNKGKYIEPIKMANMIDKTEERGAKNINWVGGDPTPNLPFILKTLNKTNIRLPQIWNSNMYCSEETMKLLNGIIDLYLTDFKYGNNKCAERLSKVKRYTEIVKRNHEIADKNGEVIIRHLVMPNHIDCCSKPILRWISEKLTDVAVNIMSQYRPTYKADSYDDISKSLSHKEFKETKEHAKKLGINQI